MGAMADRRRRQIARKGRPMQLTRAPGATPLSVTLQAYAQPPGDVILLDAVARAPLLAETTNDELSAAGYGRPSAMDKLMDGERSYTVSDAQAVYEGPTIIGWRIMAAGGS